MNPNFTLITELFQELRDPGQGPHKLYCPLIQCIIRLPITEPKDLRPKIHNLELPYIESGHHITRPIKVKVKAPMAWLITLQVLLLNFT